MVDIPSIFNVNQFFEILLPGYLAVTLLLFLIFPQFLSSNIKAGLSFDFLSAVVFLVAGPVIGVVLYQIQSCFFYFSRSRKIGLRNPLTEHFKMRLKMTDEEKQEIEEMEEKYSFSISSSIVLFIIAIIHLSRTLINGGEILWFIDIPMLTVGIILVLGAHVLRLQGIMPLYDVLRDKYQ